MSSKASNSLTVREINTDLVRCTLKQAGHGTKASLAKDTGLSAATCGNILKDLMESKEVIETQVQESNGGRPARHFRYDFNHSLALVIIPLVESELCGTFHSMVVNLREEVIDESKEEVLVVDPEAILGIVRQWVNRYPKIQVAAIGIPGVVHKGIIDHCDFKHLANNNLLELLNQEFTIKFMLENDVNLTTLGFYNKQHLDQNTSLAYFYFPKGICPGGGIIVNGQLVRGYSNYAGEIKSLPGIDEIEDDDRSIAHTIAAVSSIIDPEYIAITGDRITNKDISRIEYLVTGMIPQKHIPKIVLTVDMFEDYKMGLIGFALSHFDGRLELIERD